MRKKKTEVNTKNNSWFNRNGVAIQAVSTAVLVVVTIVAIIYGVRQFYVQRDQLEKYSDEIDIHMQQFKLVNRAKILSDMCAIEGDIQGGTIKVVNTGNLPAKDFRMMWKVIKVEGDKVVKIHPKPRKENLLSQEEIEIVRMDEVNPEEIEAIPYSSDFGYDEGVVFLIAIWKYKGHGINNFQIKDRFFYWDTTLNPKRWILTGPLDHAHSTVINKVKYQIKQVLKEEDND